MRQGIKEKDIRDFEKYAKKLDDVIRRINEYNKNVTVYLAMQNLCLLNGSSHSEFGRALQENVVTSIIISKSGGGDW